MPPEVPPEGIPFYRPDLSEREIEAVVETLRSGWITTGPRAAALEDALGSTFGLDHVQVLNSATAGLFLCLKVFGVGPGDEVITSPYSFSATAAAISHTGAKPVFADIKADLNIDPQKIAEKISPRLKAVIAVDFGGLPCAYEEIRQILEAHRSDFVAASSFQSQLGRPLLIADAAHSLGSKQNDVYTGALGDMTVFSFHAVKNITSAEGGAVVAHLGILMDLSLFFRRLKSLSLHGLSRSGFDRHRAGKWQYDVEEAGYKFNLPDILAALALEQLKRLGEFKQKKTNLFREYSRHLSGIEAIDPWIDGENCGEICPHLYPVFLREADESKRNRFIEQMAESGIICNVHYLPLPQMSLYQRLGYRVEDTPRAYQFYQREVSLPFYTRLETQDVEKIVSIVKKNL